MIRVSRAALVKNTNSLTNVASQGVVFPPKVFMAEGKVPGVEVFKNAFITNVSGCFSLLVTACFAIQL